MGSTARQTHMQDVHFLRASIALADFGSGAVKIGSLPAGARVLNTDVFIETAFNAATTNLMDVGFTGQIGAFMAQGTTLAGATGQKTSKPSGLLGVIATDTDVIVTYSQSGTAATNGLATVIVAYAPNN